MQVLTKTNEFSELYFNKCFEYMYFCIYFHAYVYMYLVSTYFKVGNKNLGGFVQIHSVPIIWQFHNMYIPDIALGYCSIFLYPHTSNIKSHKGATLLDLIRKYNVMYMQCTKDHSCFLECTYAGISIKEYCLYLSC